ncbi:hypothetical protein DP42_6546 [Burkholderia pseudomallei]|nr:hypothetical protein DP42_6546 [Burkholderia pseudomallei]
MSLLVPVLTAEKKRVASGLSKPNVRTRALLSARMSVTMYAAASLNTRVPAAACAAGLPAVDVEALVGERAAVGTGFAGSAFVETARGKTADAPTFDFETAGANGADVTASFPFPFRLPLPLPLPPGTSSVARATPPLASARYAFASDSSVTSALPSARLKP